MKEFRGKLGNYKIVKTEDNTETVWSEYFDENCHNISGAREETLYNYIEGCQILKQVSIHSPLNVFDVGFGPGLGLLYLHEALNNITTPINYYSIEIDPLLITWATQNNFKDIIVSEEKFGELQFVKFQIQNISCTVLVGDGRITIPLAIKNNLIPKIHAIFQDPFSPKKNPTLWTVEWFDLLKSISHPDVYLATYSSSVSIRKSLLESGFCIENKKGFGKKRTMTCARLIGSTKEELLAELARSPTNSLHDS